MTPSHGVVQGFNGLAVVDAHHQRVVHAEAHGSGQEAHWPGSLIKGVRENFRTIKSASDVVAKAKLTADSGFHNVKSIDDSQASGVDAYIAAPQSRRRDAAFAPAARHQERHRAEERRASGYEERKRFRTQDFLYAEKAQPCICPAGHKL
jgi:hypothetical protein